MFLLPSDFTPGYRSPEIQTDAGGLWFVFAGNQLLVEWRAGAARIPCATDWPLPEIPVLRHLYLGMLDDQPCYGVEIAPDASTPPEMALRGLRELWGVLDEALLGLGGQALQIVDWDRCHQFCGRCATAMERRDSERAKHCPACGLLNYPRIAPAIMVRVLRDDDILLARAPKFPPGRFSVLAGFAEPGETLEQCAHREVEEEVGVKIENLRYFGSQSWPFPHSLMIAFSADYVSGELRVDGVEIETAGWYTPENLPGIPPPLSIARWMIDDYLGTMRAKNG